MVTAPERVAPKPVAQAVSGHMHPTLRCAHQQQVVCQLAVVCMVHQCLDATKHVLPPEYGSCTAGFGMLIALAAHSLGRDG